ncbi:MAG: sugar phosphate isomerase/epimerase [Planctomycetota bacterium]|nr:sugar phosphate isomerase/epimerase [Planctomycetota bacterium]
MHFSVTTVMIPEHDQAETVALLQRLGYQGVEWRARRIPDSARSQPYSFWGNHKNDLTPERFLKDARTIRKLCDDHGLKLVALAPQARADQLDEVKLLADGAAEAMFCGPSGSAMVSAQPILVRIGAPRGYDGTVPYPTLYQEAVEAYGKALEITRERHVKTIVEIHGGTIMVSASLAYRIVSNFDPKDIGVIYDVNNMAKDGYETSKMALELLGPYLAHVHLGGQRPVPGDRDAGGTLRWKWEGCALADGLLHVPSIYENLKAVGFRGFTSIEDFRPGAAEAKLKESMDYLKAVGLA